MNREDEIARRLGLTGETMVVTGTDPNLNRDLDWLVRGVRAARNLRDAVIQRPDDVVPTPPNSDLAKAMGGPFLDLSILLREEA